MIVLFQAKRGEKMKWIIKMMLEGIKKDNKITWSGERWNKAGSRIMSMSV